MMRLIDADKIPWTDLSDGRGLCYVTFMEKVNAMPTITCGDMVSRNAIIQKLNRMDRYVSTELRLCDTGEKFPQNEVFIVDDVYEEIVEQLPSVQPDLGKYEYHYDHTDCIWYRPEARNRCPVTCAQYRDGWNDAMNYIFRGGKGYRPYRRGEQYEE